MNQELAEMPVEADIVDHNEAPDAVPVPRALIPHLSQCAVLLDIDGTLLDLMPYIDAKLRVNRDYQHAQAFGRKCLLNIASAGMFSSDRAVKQYAEEIWHLPRVRLGER